MDFAYTETQEEIRKAVRKLCEAFGADYWLRCDEQHAYQKEFVQAMTSAGWLAALIRCHGAGRRLQHPKHQDLRQAHEQRLRDQRPEDLDVARPPVAQALRQRDQHGEISGERGRLGGCQACMTTFGDYGVATEYHVERKWKEARLFRTAPLSNNLISTLR